MRISEARDAQLALGCDWACEYNEAAGLTARHRITRWVIDMPTDGGLYAGPGTEDLQLVTDYDTPENHTPQHVLLAFQALQRQGLI